MKIKSYIKKIKERQYIMLRDFDFKNVHSFTGYITVPKDFKTNLMSSPKLLEIIIPHDSDYTFEASIMHDFLYCKKSNLYNISRKKSDIIFKEICKENGLDNLRANILYYALRLFGWKYWKK